MVADRHSARRGDEAEEPGRFKIDAATLGTDATEKFQGGWNRDALDQEFGERDLTLGGCESSLPHGDGKIRIAVDSVQIEENIDGQEVRGSRAHDPVVDPVPPGCDRAAPKRVFCHDATPAIRHTDLMQDIRDVGSKRFEPAILLATGL